jgi:hypothetical protein
MARSSGYRANGENADRVAELRAKLSECRSDQWQRATRIMQQIAALTSTGSGPSGGRVEPRACRYCKFFGHTTQHCKQKARDYKAACERILLEERRYQLEKAKERERHAVSKELPWYQRASQADWLDEIKVPWYRDKHIGPMPVSPDKEGGEGRWMRAGGTVKRAEE